MPCAAPARRASAHQLFHVAAAIAAAKDNIAGQQRKVAAGASAGC